MRPTAQISLIATMFVLLSCAVPAAAQSPTYLNAAGNPTFGVNYPVENGFINVANGNLHIEIPLSSYKQRGKQSIDESLIYDSRIWTLNANTVGHYYWAPDNLPGATGGWRTQGGQFGGLDLIGYLVTEIPGCYRYSNFSLIDKTGTNHYFPFKTDACNNLTANGYATDGSGYYAEVTNGNTVTVYDNQGNQVYLNQMDTNGNYSTVDANYNLIDTDGRTPVIATTSGDTTTYEVLTVGGSRIAYTVTMETVYYNTQFNEDMVTDESGSFQAIQSIQLPDGTSYAFQYDSGTSAGHYGELTQVTLPTGGVVKYNYLIYDDSFGNANRWVWTRQDQFGTATFTPTVITSCGSGSTGCEEQMKVQKPSGDTVNYQLTLNNGAWNTQTDYYTSTYAGGASPVMTTVTNYNFSNQCDPSICLGAEYIQASSSTTTLDDAGLTAQTAYTFAQPWTGKPTKIQQWDYYPATQQPSSIPTRETDITYNETVNGAALPTYISYLDQNGNPLTAADINYDETAPVPTSGIVNHQAVTGNRGNVTSVTYGNPESALAEWIYTYDDTGTVLSVTDPNGYVNPSQHTTSYGYDPTDTYVVKTTRPAIGGAQHVSTAQYDPSTGFIVQNVDENSQATNISYDSLGRTQQITYPDGGSVAYSYPQPEIQTVATRTISAAPAVSMTQTTANDPYGRPSQVTSSDPAGNSTVYYTYDGNGRLASATTPERSTPSGTDGTESYAYDWLDCYTSITRADGNSVGYSYSGNTATVTDENGNKKEYQYDAFANLSAVVEADTSGVLDWETDYTHDALNNLTSITQKGDADSTQWRTRSFSYDPLSRLISETTPETGTVNYGYDSNGNMVTIETPAYDVNLTYDALNRLTGKVSSGFFGGAGGVVDSAYSYDNGEANCHSIGRMTVAGTISQQPLVSQGVKPLLVLPKNSTSYCYDSMGRISDETWSYQGSIYGVSAQYDYAGDLQQLTYPDGRTLTRTYGTDDRLYNVEYSAWNGQAESSAYFTPNSYMPTGQLTGGSFGNGVQLIAGYNNRGSILGVGYYTGTSFLWANAYQWAPNAMNLQTITDATGETNPLQFSYDPLNRIASVQGGGPVGGGSAFSESYAIDAWGNMNESGYYTLGTAYTTANQFSTASGYSYDAAGDLLTDGIGDTFTYDTDGDVLSVRGAESYNFGADRHMEYSTTAEGTTDYVYLGDLLVGKYQPGSASWTDMIYGAGSSLIATVAGTQTAVPNYRLADYLGSLGALTDGSGNVLESNTFLPYGEEISGNTLDPFLFTGLEREPDASTDRALYRQYTSTDGRWLTPDLYHGSYDLMDPQSFNRYAYVNGRPTFHTGLHEPAGEVVTPVGAEDR